MSIYRDHPLDMAGAELSEPTTAPGFGWGAILFAVHHCNIDTMEVAHG